MNTEKQPTPIHVVDEKPLPKALLSLVDNANKTLEETQQRLVNEIQTSAIELMEIMNLKYDEGWRLDLGKSRFVKIGPQQSDVS